MALSSRALLARSGRVAGRTALTASPPQRQGSHDALWMPFTANKAFKETRAPKTVVRGKGMYFYDADNRAIMDTMGGLWCSAAGISPDPVVAAVQEQVATLSYAPLFQIGHELAFEWAEALVSEAHCDLKARGLDKVFFTMCGSTSVDTALKMALAYHRANGEGTRTRFIGRERGYHGVGLGGISVGGIGPNRHAFSAALLPGVDHLPHTHSLAHSAFHKGQPAWGAHLADHLEDLVNMHGALNIAAVVVEPVAGSTGVLPPPVGYLEKLRAICDAHGILLIFDEVITGFGRLNGSPFATSHFDVTPDILALAKGLTGAVVPAGAVVVQGKVYGAVVGTHAGGIEFFHGYTYSGHPLAAAAGLAMLKHLTDGGLYARAAALGPFFEAHLHATFAHHSCVVDVRNMGLMGAVQLATIPGAAPGAFGAAVMDHAWHKENLFLRVSGDNVVFSPAFIASEEDVAHMFTGAKRAIEAARKMF